MNMRWRACMAPDRYLSPAGPEAFTEGHTPTEAAVNHVRFLHATRQLNWASEWRVHVAHVRGGDGYVVTVRRLEEPTFVGCDVRPSEQPLYRHVKATDELQRRKPK